MAVLSPVLTQHVRRCDTQYSGGASSGTDGAHDSTRAQQHVSTASDALPRFSGATASGLHGQLLNALSGQTAPWSRAGKWSNTEPAARAGCSLEAASGRVCGRVGSLHGGSLQLRPT
eukprot:83272-Rhodomonas_salina.4